MSPSLGQGSAAISLGLGSDAGEGVGGVFTQVWLHLDH